MIPNGLRRSIAVATSEHDGFPQEFARPVRAVGSSTIINLAGE
jgi:hypothetical protein